MGKLTNFLSGNSEKHPDYMSSRGERISYSLYFAGQAFSYALMVLLLPSFMFFLGIDTAVLAALILGAKIWDACNDTIFGVIFDKIRFKSGKKVMPWIKLSVIIIPLFTMFMFLLPDSLSDTGKIVWFMFAYVLWDMAYTVSDVPIYTYVTSMTDNLKERNNTLAVARVFAMAGSGVFLLGSILTSEEVGVDFYVVAIIACVLTVATMLPICFSGKERIFTETKPEERYNFKILLKYLKTNKYLTLFYLGFILNGIMMTSAAIELFVSYYLFGNTLFTVLTYAISAVPSVIIVFFVPKLLKRFDKFKMYRNCMIAVILLNIIIYFVGYGAGDYHIFAFIALVAVRSVPMALWGVFHMTFTPDCVEYGYYKTGVEARGVAFAVQSFAAKINSVSQAVALFILAAFGWIAIEGAKNFADLEALQIVQPPSAMDGLWFVYVMVPVIGAVLGLIPWFFYKLNDKDVQIMAKCNAGEITREEAEATLSRKY